MPSLEDNISVFDLPNLRYHPSFLDLQSTLQALQIKPTIWGQTSPHFSDSSEEAGISRYLTGIISSGFEWFEDAEDAEEKREILWDLASKRLTERCGRTAMGELNRTWTIPESGALPEMGFTIREPPLTGDNLGFKTWGTAYAIAKKLEFIGSNLLKNVLSPGAENRSANAAKVLELGSGTGLVGIAAAAVWSTSVLLTDLPDIQNNLDFNIQANIKTVSARGGQITNHVLDWKSEAGLVDYPSQEFSVIIAADSIYDNDHPQLVASMIKKHLKQGPSSRALVAVPLRDKTTILLAGEFRKELQLLGLEVRFEGSEICADDWKEGDEEVKCWWAVLALVDASDRE